MEVDPIFIFIKILNIFLLFWVLKRIRSGNRLTAGAGGGGGGGGCGGCCTIMYLGPLSSPPPKVGAAAVNATNATRTKKNFISFIFIC